MPQFDPKREAPASNGTAVTRPTRKGIPVITEPRCKVCTSPQRKAVDRMLAAGFTYSEIERQFASLGIPRRSISRHAREHLNYEEAAIRQVVENEAAAAQRNFDEGVQRLVTKNAYLEVALQKGYDALINNDTIVEPKDAVKIIETLSKLQEQGQSVALDELRVQFQFFMQAVKELIPKETWEQIVDRTATLLRASGREVEWGAPPAIEEVVDAEVVATDADKLP